MGIILIYYMIMLSDWGC